MTVRMGRLKLDVVARSKHIPIWNDVQEVQVCVECQMNVERIFPLSFSYFLAFTVKWITSLRADKRLYFSFILSFSILFLCMIQIIVVNTTDILNIDCNISINWIAKFTMKLFLFKWCFYRFENGNFNKWNGIEFIDFNYQHFISIFEWTNPLNPSE